MKKIFVLFSLFASSVAFAADKAPAATPAPEKKFFLVEEQLLQAVMQYLASRPYQETFQIIPALQQGVSPFKKEEACKK